MKRRAFISLLGGAAAWPLGAGAQQGERMRRIGVLMGLDPDDASVRPNQLLAASLPHGPVTDPWGAADIVRRQR